MKYYGNYYWSGLVLYGITPFYKALGWHECAYNSINASNYPKSVQKSCIELTSNEQKAAEKVWYTKKR